MLKLSKETEEHIGMIIGELRNNRLSRKLHDAMRGWLISPGSEAEKEERLLELFADTFSYSRQPSNKARFSLKELYRNNDIEHKFTTKPVRIPLRRRLRFQAAAALALMITISGSVFLLIERVDGTVEPNRVAMITVSAPAASFPTETTGVNAAHKVVSGDETYTLPDQSRVRLGEGGTISHAENFEGERRVELRGEAHFNVTKARTESDHFTVHTDHFDITVLGTQFDVHSPAGESHSEINLYHGSVEVIAGGRAVRMNPTDHLRYDHATREITLTTIPYEKLRYDEMPGLVFEKASMTEVLAKLEREFGVSFSIEGQIPEQQTHIDGDMTLMKSLDEVMRRLQILSGRFDYEICEKEIRIKIHTI